MKSMKSSQPSTSGDRKSIRLGQVVFAAVVMVGLPAVILFGAAGQLTWGLGWAYIGLTLAFVLASRLILLWKNPELLAERGQALDNAETEPWDKTLMPLVAMIGPLIMLLVAGLDKRFGWSPALASWVPIMALGITALGYVLGTWATIVNHFFSAVVRIQRERGQTVVSSGPYGYVRHPGYAATLVTNITVPLALGSLWALVPALLVSGLLVVRTALEDRTLQAKLAGYSHYAGQVRYRLVPGVW